MIKIQYTRDGSGRGKYGKCEPAEEPAYWAHKDGLVAIG